MKTEKWLNWEVKLCGNIWLKPPGNFLNSVKVKEKKKTSQYCVYVLVRVAFNLTSKILNIFLNLKKKDFFSSV